MAGSSQPITSLVPAINDLIASTRAGLIAGNSPKPTNEGAGGSYFMSDESGICFSVFKPLDEEPKAANRPQQQQSTEENNEEPSVVEVTPEGSRIGTKAGKGGYREAAAYRLDHPKSGRRSDSGETFGFAGVPPTTFVRCRDEYFKNHQRCVPAKLGSLQKYIDNTVSCLLIGPDVYNKFPLHEVHKIAVLDIRLANADRHGGNILRSKSFPAELTPIDHGYCLPVSFGGAKFVWLDWEGANEQFSDETIEYIKTLDAEEDIRLLQSFGPGLALPTARVFRVSTMLLKEGAKRGLTPYKIGNIMCRSINDEECEIEKIFNEASKKFPLKEDASKKFPLKEDDKEDDSKFIEFVTPKIDSLLDGLT